MEEISPLFFLRTEDGGGEKKEKGGGGRGKEKGVRGSSISYFLYPIDSFIETEKSSSLLNALSYKLIL